MAHPQDLLNKYVKYRVDPGGILQDALKGQFVDGVLPGQTTAISAKVQSDLKPLPVIGPLTSKTWHFTFLKYIGGAVTIAPLTGDILTGPMTGCYLCTYKESGANHLAHIGTANAPDSTETIDVKNKWKAFVARPEVTGVMGASPYDLYTNAEYQNAMTCGVAPMTCGYFTPGGQAYALLLAPTDNQQSLVKVAGVKPMPLFPWTTLALKPEFA